MTQNQFMILCADLTIDCDIALENDDLVEALKLKDDALVLEILTTQF